MTSRFSQLSGWVEKQQHSEHDTMLIPASQPLNRTGDHPSGSGHARHSQPSTNITENEKTHRLWTIVGQTLSNYRFGPKRLAVDLVGVWGQIFFSPPPSQISNNILDWRLSRSWSQTIMSSTPLSYTNAGFLGVLWHRCILPIDNTIYLFSLTYSDYINSPLLQITISDDKMLIEVFIHHWWLSTMVASICFRYVYCFRERPLLCCHKEWISYSYWKLFAFFHFNTESEKQLPLVQ